MLYIYEINRKFLQCYKTPGLKNYMEIYNSVKLTKYVEINLRKLNNCYKITDNCYDSNSLKLKNYIFQKSLWTLEIPKHKQFITTGNTKIFIITTVYYSENL